MLADVYALVFDFDGTLANCPYDFTHMRQRVLALATTFGLDTDRLAPLRVLEAIEEGARMLAGIDGQCERFRRSAHELVTAIEYEAAKDSYLLPGVPESLIRLHGNGFRLGIVTRNAAVVVKRIIGDTVLPYDALLCREDVTLTKPHPDHVLQALRLIGATPEAALMVGDHPMDIDMGKAAGMRTVGVLTGPVGEETLRAAAPDLILPSVLELAEMLLDARA